MWEFFSRLAGSSIVEGTLRALRRTSLGCSELNRAGDYSTSSGDCSLPKRVKDRRWRLFFAPRRSPLLECMRGDACRHQGLPASRDDTGTTELGQQGIERRWGVGGRRLGLKRDSTSSRRRRWVKYSTQHVTCRAACRAGCRAGKSVGQIKWGRRKRVEASLIYFI